MNFGPSFTIERPHSRGGAPRCGVYLTTPKPLRLQQFIIQARRAFAALNASPYEKNMHALELRFPKRVYEKERQAAGTLVQLCRNNGIVAIVRGDLGLAVECGADGLLLEKIEDFPQARHVLGEQAILGLDCGNSQELAEAALQAGIDYVVFSKFFSPVNAKRSAELSLLAWWGTRTELPAVAHANLNVSRALQMAHLGAGFIGAGDWVWEHEEGPARAIYWLQEAIEQGLKNHLIN